MPTPVIARIRSALLAVCMAATLLNVGGPAAAQDLPPFIGPTHYVTMSDGVEIAVNVRMPTGYRKGQRVPTIFEMSGYDGASNNDQTWLGYMDDELGNPGLPLQDGSRQLVDDFYDNGFATVNASVRGSGCSGGEFDIFAWRQALDGREVIQWISEQPWSNGKVGIMGHSYSGITGTMVAATRPPALVAVTVSGLIDDLYRGLVYMGGIFNNVFPALWTAAVRPAYDVLGGQVQPIITGPDERCARNMSTHSRVVVNDPFVQTTASNQTDNDWWRSKSLVTYIERVNVPIHITGAYSDEQTGPRGPAHLWEMVKGVPKRLILSNGDHGTCQSITAMNDRVAWMEHWMRGIDGGHGTLRADKTSVRVLLETHSGECRPGTPSSCDEPNGELHRRTFPLEDTKWTDYYFREGQTLLPAPPQRGEQFASYVSGTKRQAWWRRAPGPWDEAGKPSGPDELSFRSAPMKRNLAIAGPILATLYMSSTATDTDMFVQLIDEGPDGSYSYLQRGLLRASHRAVDPGLSDWTVDRTSGRKINYRPFRPHVNPTSILPGQVYRYDVEVFPVGHVFRPGHRILVKVHAPPAFDNDYGYPPFVPPGVNSVYFDYERASKITLPVVSLAGAGLGKELPCGGQNAVRCVP